MWRTGGWVGREARSGRICGELEDGWVELPDPIELMENIGGCGAQDSLGSLYSI